MIKVMAATDSGRETTTSRAPLWWLAVVAQLVTGCSTISTNATQSLTSSLAVGIRNQTSVETVRDGIPSYLLLIDGYIMRNPDDRGLLMAGSEIYTAYAGVLDNAPRARSMAAKAKQYAARALCIQSEPLCTASTQPFEAWEQALDGIDESVVPELYRLAASWATVIQLADGDWNAIADVPKVEVAIQRIVELSPQYESGWPQLYLGVLATLLPPAYGGKPEEGREYFEAAIELSEGRNLMTYVLFAQEYARLVFDQELHDELLRTALGRPVEEPDLTLVNTLAHQRAQELLDSSADYF